MQNIQYENIKPGVVCFKILFEPHKMTDANKKMLKKPRASNVYMIYHYDGKFPHPVHY